MHRLICWFRGHVWRYDGHVWGSGLAAYDLFACERCGCDHAVEALSPEPAAS